MKTYTIDVFCEGRTRLGVSMDEPCAGAATVGPIKNMCDERLPDGWGAVLMRDIGRVEFCPFCFKLWRDREIAERQRNAPTAEALKEFRQRCAAFDWNYAWTDDHGVYLERDAEFQQLRDMALRHPSMMEIFKNEQEESATRTRERGIEEAAV